jgi:uncharacterized membrane protein (Fun14 family)
MSLGLNPPLTILDDMARAWGSLSLDLPGIILLAGPFIAGFIAGYVVKQGLKLVILLGISLLILEYVGYSTLPRLSEFLQAMAERYGSQLLALVLAMNPVGIGFVIGFLVALIFT